MVKASDSFSPGTGIKRDASNFPSVISFSINSIHFDIIMVSISLHSIPYSHSFLILHEYYIKSYRPFSRPRLFLSHSTRWFNIERETALLLALPKYRERSTRENLLLTSNGVSWSVRFAAIS